VGRGRGTPRPEKPASPFRYFNSSPEVIRLAVMIYVRFPLSLRNVEDFLFERGMRSYKVALTEFGCGEKQEVGRWVNNRVENSHLPFRGRERALARFRRMKTLQKFTSIITGPRTSYFTC
jgi:transposase-like protein